MMLVLNIDFFHNMFMWGLFEQRNKIKTNKMGLARLVRLTPQHIWYIQHPISPMFELIPSMGFIH